MAIKVGINGFGRIGRMVFRAAIENFAKDHSILVLGKIPYKVSDMFQEPDYICNFILINGQNMPCFFRKYNDVPWLVDGQDSRERVCRIL